MKAKINFLKLKPCNEEALKRAVYPEWMKTVVNKILSIGGYYVQEHPLFDKSDKLFFKAMKERGRLWSGKSLLMVGRPSQCHKNSCDLWFANKDRDNCRICTGFALSEDGLWRIHSWVVNIRDDGNMQIVETTVKRLAYFGYIMSTEECETFDDDNF